MRWRPHKAQLVFALVFFQSNCPIEDKMVGSAVGIHRKETYSLELEGREGSRGHKVGIRIGRLHHREGVGVDVSQVTTRHNRGIFGGLVQEPARTQILGSPIEQKF